MVQIHLSQPIPDPAGSGIFYMCNDCHHVGHATEKNKPVSIVLTGLFLAIHQFHVSHRIELGLVTKEIILHYFCLIRYPV